MGSKFYIYLIKNTVNNKHYVGQTTRLERRIEEHLAHWPTSKSALQLAVAKYGRESFSVIVLATATTEETATVLEDYFMIFYNCKMPHGYNLSESAKPGVVHSEETRKKMSQAQRRRPAVSAETRRRMSAALSKPKSPEHRKSMSEVRKGVSRPYIVGKYGKPVRGTCIITGNTIEYENINAVRRDGFNPECVEPLVNRRTKAKQHKGYRWEKI
jgi:group I intron endonuclease